MKPIDQFLAERDHLSIIGWGLGYLLGVLVVGTVIASLVVFLSLLVRIIASGPYS
jgi:hypothetical protein